MSSTPIETVAAARRGLKLRIVRDFSWLSVGSFLTFPLIIAQGFVAARWLGPVRFGAWSVCQLIVFYSMYLHMGAGHSLLRELPLPQDGEGQRRLVGSGLTITLISTSLAGAAVYFTRGFIAGTDTPGMHTALVFTSATLVLQGVFQYAVFCYRGQARFPIIVKSSLALNVAVLLLLVVLTPRWGVVGCAIAWFSAYLIAAIALWKSCLSRYGFCFDVIEWKRVLRVGAPIFITDIIFALVWSVDRLAITVLRTHEDLGYYSVAAVFLRLLVLFPDLVQQTLYFHWTRNSSASSGGVEPHVLLGLPARLLCWAMPSLQGFAFILIPWAITITLPKYAPSIPLAQVLVLGIGFLAMGQFFAFFLTTSERKQSLTSLQLKMVALRAILAFGSLALGFGLLTLALLNLFCNLLYALRTIAAVSRDGAHNLIRVRDLLIPWTLIVGVVLLADGLRQRLTPSVGLTTSTAVSLGILSLVIASFFFLGRRNGRHNVFAEVSAHIASLRIGS